MGVATRSEFLQNLFFLLLTHMPTSTNKRAKDWNYEAALQQIELVIAQLETGELALADVFDQFNKAVEELKHCDNFLKEKQAQAKLLIESLADDE
jgi:exodeoxyribonuclease VII small subunit